MNESTKSIERVMETVQTLAERDDKEPPMDAFKIQAMIDKAKKEAASKFHVASVELESSGGGGGWGKNSAAKEGLDLASLMKGLDGKTEREPSAAGLQKNIGGEPIGVAADNIFLQVSRRYQQKIQAQSFIK
jgi:hypothetical protein